MKTKGQIVKIISNAYTVSSNKEEFTCHMRGKFRNLKMTPVVGDYVTIDTELKTVEEILPRKNYLIRPFVANIDQAIIVTSVKEPDLSLNLLDKLLVIMHKNNIEPIICLTKIDLLNKDELQSINKLFTYYESLGYKVLHNSEENKIIQVFKNKTTVLTGQTGAGKSSLLNRLDKSLELKTGEISKALGRGKHTTRHVELLELFDGKVLDTPGFSNLDFSSFTKEEIKDAFIEFDNYSCKYRDCMHLKEEECRVKDALNSGAILASRYENYQKILAEVKK